MEGSIYFLLLVSLLHSGLSLEVTVCPGIGGCECHGQIVNCSGRGLIEIPDLPRPASSNKDSTIVLLLDNNSITGLPKQALQGMYISQLQLSDNQLSAVSDQAFTGVVGVVQLLMDRCGLSSVPAAISQLSDLTKLSLRGNGISILRERIFSKLTRLKELDLAGNRVNFRLSLTSFNNLVSLESLDLSMNNLHVVPTEVLQSLVLLKNLVLQDNNIQTLSDNLFLQNGNLTTLSLLNNPVQFISPKAFAPLNKLETLEISDSRFAEFNRSNFGNKPHLKRLTIRDCDIYSVHANLLNDIVKNLNFLDISGSDSLWNSLRDKIHKNGKNLKVLKLSSLNIKDVPTFIFKNWDNLCLLELKDNDITQLKRWAFEGLKGKEVEIHLENNHISEISPYLFHDTTLPLFLYLNGNTNITSLGFISKHPCAFDRSIVDVSGLNFSCTCDTVKVVQKKLVSLDGYCGEDSLESFRGLKLGAVPPVGIEPVRGVHLEAEGTQICGLENHLTEKYSCCSDEWVALDTPITCAVKAKSSCLHSSAFILSVTCALYACYSLW